jgi:hypothetical protein
MINESTLDTNFFSIPSIYEQILSLTIFPYSLQMTIVILCHTTWKPTKFFSTLISFGQVSRAYTNSLQCTKKFKRKKTHARAWWVQILPQDFLRMEAPNLLFIKYLILSIFKVCRYHKLGTCRKHSAIDIN